MPSYIAGVGQRLTTAATPTGLAVSAPLALENEEPLPTPSGSPPPSATTPSIGNAGEQPSILPGDAVATIEPAGSGPAEPLAWTTPNRLVGFNNQLPQCPTKDHMVISRFRRSTGSLSTGRIWDGTQLRFGYEIEEAVEMVLWQRLITAEGGSRQMVSWDAKAEGDQIDIQIKNLPSIGVESFFLGVRNDAGYQTCAEIRVPMTLTHSIPRSGQEYCAHSFKDAIQICNIYYNNMGSEVLFLLNGVPESDWDFFTSELKCTLVGMLAKQIKKLGILGRALGIALNSGCLFSAWSGLQDNQVIFEVEQAVEEGVCLAIYRSNFHRKDDLEASARRPENFEGVNHMNPLCVTNYKRQWTTWSDLVAEAICPTAPEFDFGGFLVRGASSCDELPMTV